MKCGFCTFFCPVYQEDGWRQRWPEARTTLTKLRAQGGAEFTPEMGEIMRQVSPCASVLVNAPKGPDRTGSWWCEGADGQDKGLPWIQEFAFRKVMSKERPSAGM